MTRSADPQPMTRSWGFAMTMPLRDAFAAVLLTLAIALPAQAQWEAVDENDGLTVIVLMNLADADPGTFAHVIAAVIEPALKPVPKPVPARP